MNLETVHKENIDYLISLRHHLHKNPELSWQEFNTTKFIIEELKKIGIENISKPLKTGLIALIEGKNPSKKCIALRADIDALPILETNNCSYKSTNEGVMHACGHDVHITCLIGAAKLLYSNRENFEGTIKIIFQPSEEKQPSGAEEMIKMGCLENPKVSSIIGLHVTPELRLGKLGFKNGKFMASADEIYITINGKGGHAASPHLCIDPIIISANILLALQQLVSRYANPLTPTVLSFGDIQGHGATNIIPSKVELKGTLRTFDEVWRKELHTKIKNIVESISSSFGATADISIPKGLSYVENNDNLTNILRNKAKNIFGEENVVEMQLRMGAEDFSAYSHKVPGCFFRLGTGKEENNTNITVHNSNFDIEHDSLSIGAYSLYNFAIEMIAN